MMERSERKVFLPTDIMVYFRDECGEIVTVGYYEKSRAMELFKDESLVKKTTLHKGTPVTLVVYLNDDGKGEFEEIEIETNLIKIENGRKNE